MIIIIIIIALCISYYLYLNNLYIIDETFEVNNIKELSINEKTTIRVIISDNKNNNNNNNNNNNERNILNNFILHYSICPIVNEIQILWNLK